MVERGHSVKERERPLRWDLLTRVRYYAFDFEENPKDVVRRFLQYGLFHKEIIGCENPKMTFLSEDGTESPQVLHLGCFGKKNGQSDLLEIELGLPKKVYKEIRCFARENGVKFGQACDSLVGLSLEMFKTMQEHDLYIPTPNGEKVSHRDMIKGDV